MNTISNLENDRSAGRSASLDALATALDVPRDALDDDAACLRAIAKIVGVAATFDRDPNPRPVVATPAQPPAPADDAKAALAAVHQLAAKVDELQKQIERRDSPPPATSDPFPRGGGRPGRG